MEPSLCPFPHPVCRISPIPVEKRVDKRTYQLFFIWFSVNFNIISFGTGSSGPVFFSLGVRDSILVILIVNLMYVFPWGRTIVVVPFAIS